MKLIGNTNLVGKLTSIGAVSLSSLGLSDNFYGGSVKSFLATKEGLYLCRDKKNNIIDIAYNEATLSNAGRKLLGLEAVEETEQPLEELNVKTLKLIAKEKGIEFNKNAGKEIMLELLKGGE